MATEATDCELQVNKYKNNVYDVIYTNGNNLTKIFEKFKKLFSGQIQLDKWLNSRYVPTPTIIEAAIALYEENSVEEITRHGGDIDNASEELRAIINHCKKKQ